MKTADFVPLARMLERAAPGGAYVALLDVSEGKDTLVAAFGGDGAAFGGDDTGPDGAGLPGETVAYLKSADLAGRDWFESYGPGLSGGAPTHTAVYLIRDGGKLAGLLTVVSRVDSALSLGKSLLQFAGLESGGLACLAGTGPAVPALGSSGSGAVDKAAEALDLDGIHASRLTGEELASIVQYLTDGGGFSADGAVLEAAAALGVSASTVYRCMTKRRKLQKDKQRKSGVPQP